MFRVFQKWFGERVDIGEPIADHDTALAAGLLAAVKMNNGKLPAPEDKGLSEGEVYEIFVLPASEEDGAAETLSEEAFNLYCDWLCVAAWECEGIEAWVRVVGVQS